MHTYLALDMNAIPESTKQYVPTFWRGKFSNDGIRNDDDNGWIKEPSLMLIDGYNEKGELTHPMPVLKKWLVGFSDEDAEIKIQELMDTAIEYSQSEIKTEMMDENSIWYEAQ